MDLHHPCEMSLRKRTTSSPRIVSVGRPVSSKDSQSTLRYFFGPASAPPKRPLEPAHCVPLSSTDIFNPQSSENAFAGPSRHLKEETKQILPKSKPSWTQMHLTHLPLLHTCKECSMSYVRGGGEDESLHAKHHSRVVRGVIWDGLGPSTRRQTGPGGEFSSSPTQGKSRISRDQTRDRGWRTVEEGVSFGAGRGKITGKVVGCDGSWGGNKVRHWTEFTWRKEAIADVCHCIAGRVSRHG